MGFNMLMEDWEYARNTKAMELSTQPRTVQDWPLLGSKTSLKDME